VAYVRRRVGAQFGVVEGADHGVGGLPIRFVGSVSHRRMSCSSKSAESGESADLFECIDERP
jgi:hypothetical protein